MGQQRIKTLFQFCHFDFQGFDAGLPRRPLGALSAEEKKKVDALLANMGDIL